MSQRYVRAAYYGPRRTSTEVARLAEVIAYRPSELLDLLAFANAGSITLGTAWFLAQLVKTIVPLVVDYLSRRRLLQTIEKLAASPCSILAHVTFPRTGRDQPGCASGRCADHKPGQERVTFGTTI